MAHTFTNLQVPRICPTSADVGVLIFSLEKTQAVHNSGGLRVEQFPEYATGVDGVVQIESRWTPRRRERAVIALTLGQLPHSSK
jgi:hypothetical protein